MKYRKRPVVIEAWHRSHGEIPNWVRAAITLGLNEGWDFWHLGTLEGVMRADPEDWILRGVMGEVYPCKPDIFAATYEVVGP